MSRVNLIYLLVVLLSFSFNSCMVMNLTKEEKNICQIHEVKMHKRLNATNPGKHFYSYEKFPNCGGKVPLGCNIGPWPKDRLAWHYVCKECTSDHKEFRSEWKKKYGFN